MGLLIQTKYGHAGLRVKDLSTISHVISSKISAGARWHFASAESSPWHQERKGSRCSFAAKIIPTVHNVAS